jgi:hypothetical protein
MKITADQFNKLRTTSKSGNWKKDIVDYLKGNQGVAELKLYNDTRPDRLDISEAKKRHNLASQYTYLRDEGYLVQKQDDKVFLLTEPSDKPGEFQAVAGMEQRLKALL